MIGWALDLLTKNPSQHVRRMLLAVADERADEDVALGDLIKDAQTPEVTNAVYSTLLQEQLHSVLDTLSEREAGVVSMRFGLTDGQPKTLNEIGKV
jgi:DNA-directed RNA polymerase sigma subunit (sigma70/sigma32)